MIPVNISAESILKSLAHIDQNGIPKDRHSVKWSVQHQKNITLLWNMQQEIALIL